MLLNSVHVFAFSNPPKKLSVFETSDNPSGLACLDHKVLAFPGRSPGQVQLIELETGNISIIPAHSTPLRAMALSPDGKLLATASESVMTHTLCLIMDRLLISIQGTLVRIFATGNCTKLAELRRGVDHAVIFSIAFSPSNTLLAVTSDKSTLHVFDIPHQQPISRRSQSPTPTSEEATPSQKWGILGKIPLLPRVFSDVYSFASAHFEIGEGATSSYVQPSGASFGRPQKGLIGWCDDQVLLVVGSGREGRWEKFVLREGEEGKRYCVRDGWKRYLGGS